MADKPATPITPLEAIPSTGTINEPVAPPNDANPDTHVVVMHGLVGPWPQHSVLSLDALKRAAVDVGRLLRIGAVKPFDPKNPPENFPIQTLAEAVRSSSPPTLPNAQGLATTPEEVAVAMDPSNTTVTGPLSETRGVAAESPIDALQTHPVLTQTQDDTATRTVPGPNGEPMVRPTPERVP